MNSNSGLMKKCALITLLVSLFLISCTQKEVLLFTEQEITTSENSIVFINIPQVEGTTQIATKINSTIQRVIGQSLSFKETNSTVITSLEEQINSFNQEYKKFKKDFPDTPVAWEAQIDGEIIYQSDEIITVALTIYTNTGGAHGISKISLINFDPNSGDKFTNEKLFSDLSSIKTIAEALFKKEIKNNEENYFDSETFILPENIGYTEEGVLLLYNVYEIAPYASGITEVVLPFEDIEDYLNFY